MKALFTTILLSLLLATGAHANDDYSQAELNQLLAPVALYPDTVLSHLLIASTYPLEIVQAQRWSEQNSRLKGEDAVNAASSQSWDPSVQALVAFPDILERMADDLDWTQQIGDAFLQDEAMVLATVQDLRQRAYEAGNLKTTDHQEVVVEKQTIIIEPRVAEVIYIPYYDTRVVYGNWYWSGYQPVVWHRPSRGYWHGDVFWSHGSRISTSFYFSSFHWHNHHTVVIDRRSHKHPNFRSGRSLVSYKEAKRWRHNPTHRRGVEYRHTNVREQYAAPSRSPQRLNSNNRYSEPRAARVERTLKARPSPQNYSEQRRRTTSLQDSVQPRTQRAQPESRANRLEQRAPSRQRTTTTQQRETDRAQLQNRRNTRTEATPSQQRRVDQATQNRAQRNTGNANNQSFQRSNQQRIERSGGRTTSDRAGARRTTRDR